MTTPDKFNPIAFAAALMKCSNAAVEIDEQMALVRHTLDNLGDALIELAATVECFGDDDE